MKLRHQYFKYLQFYMFWEFFKQQGIDYEK